jgi:hypothetical protein
MVRGRSCASRWVYRLSHSSRCCDDTAAGRCRGTVPLLCSAAAVLVGRPASVAVAGAALRDAQQSRQAAGQASCVMPQPTHADEEWELASAVWDAECAAVDAAAGATAADSPVVAASASQRATAAVDASTERRKRRRRGRRSSPVGGRGSNATASTVLGTTAQSALLAPSGCTSTMQLKPDHALRPLWVCPDGRVLMERFNRYYQQAYDFLVAVAEPVCRPRNMHEYRLTQNSLYAAAAVGLDTNQIVSVLSKLSKVEMSEELKQWIQDSTRSFGKAKLVLRQNRHWIESSSRGILGELLSDSLIASARAADDRGAEQAVRYLAFCGSAEAREDAEPVLATSTCAKTQATTSTSTAMDSCTVGVTPHAAWYTPVANTSSAAASLDTARLPTDQAHGSTYLEQLGDGAVNDIGEIVAPWEAHRTTRRTFKFALRDGTAEAVKQRCIERQTPLLEEYDFRHDSYNPPLRIDVKPLVQLRDYQVSATYTHIGTHARIWWTGRKSCSLGGRRKA